MANSLLIPSLNCVAFLIVNLLSFSVLRCAVVVSIPFGLTCHVFGQDSAAARTAEESFSDGVALMNKAEKSDTAEEKVSHLRQAIGRFRASVTMQPGHKRASAMWAQALDLLVRHTANLKSFDQNERRQWAQEAMQRYSIAGESAGSNWKYYDDWGLFLTYYTEHFATNQSESQANLVEARDLFEKCLGYTDLQFNRVLLESHLGGCLVRLAAVQTKTEERRRLYQLAGGKFQSAYEKSEVTFDGDVLSDWGEALLEVGRIDKDLVLLLQAVEHFRSSLQQQPGKLDTRFKLVRTYALLDQPDRAVEELRICAEGNPTRTAGWAPKESDLVTLRENAGFREIIGDKAAKLSPESIYRAGVNLQGQAEKLDSSAATASYQRAVELYERAATARPDYYGAQFMWANCLSKLSQIATNANERQSLARSARERFAVAARCPGADWRIYYNWAALLTARVDALADNPADTLAVLNEARGLFEKSLTLAPFSGDKALVDHDSGMCLIMLAERTPNPRDKRPLYEKAISQIGFAADRSPKLMTGRAYGLLGVALLQVAKLDNDHMMMRKASERLLSSLEIDPNNAEARYNLVCAYALLDQANNALRHLRICLDNDPNRAYYNAAVTDPDLWTLRRTAEYNNIFNPRPNTNDLTKPQLSDR